MILARELAIGALDIVLARVSRDAEDLVVILVFHDGLSLDHRYGTHPGADRFRFYAREQARTASVGIVRPVAGHSTHPTEPLQWGHIPVERVVAERRLDRFGKLRTNTAGVPSLRNRLPATTSRPDVQDAP
jgi:hypothetical protein